jgi:DNA helicase-2/ATP-dependent DNA helicase PcrA
MTEDLITAALSGLSLETQYSTYQQEIFNFAVNGAGHGIVEAVAGSGKTTTLIECVKRVNGTCLVMAFNKSIQTELQTKLRGSKNITVSTLHNFGLQLLTEHFQNITVDVSSPQKSKFHKVKTEMDPMKKKRNIVFKTLDKLDDSKDKRQLCHYLIKMTKAVQDNIIDCNKTEEIELLIDRHFTDLHRKTNIKDQVMKYLPIIVQKCKESYDKVDFEDMIWLPSQYDIKSQHYDWVFLDEAQDINVSQLLLFLRAVSSTTRVMIFGDPAQAIYAWRGACSDSIQQIADQLTPTVTRLPLSLTYRCPKSHVALAQRIVPQIIAKHDAEVGTITEDLSMTEAQPMIKIGDMILCRKNKPMVQLAFQLLREGKKAYIIGEPADKDALLERLDDGKSLTMIIQEAKQEMEETVSLLEKRGQSTKAAITKDLFRTFIWLAEQHTSVEELRNRIKMMFTGSDYGPHDAIRCSSVHRAKGLEADRVWIIVTKINKKMIKEEWQRKEERNITYVAWTRSKRDLFFIDGKAEQMQIQ